MSIARPIALIAGGFVLAALAGCNSSGPGGGGNTKTSTGGMTAGGTTGSGGAAGGLGGISGSGGSSGSGGLSGSGGAASSGGAKGSGGMPASGGAPGTGGATSGTAPAGSGGITATGGITGIGGIGATGGAGSGGTKATGTGAANGSGGITGTGGLGASGGAQGGATGPSDASGSPDGAGSTCPPAQPLTGGQQYCSNGKGSAGGNYSYELWSSGDGSGCMTVYRSDAKFSATWTNVGDFLARIGLQFDQTKTPAQIGTISSDFAETKTGNTGLTYVGIYGWTVNPLREYYIIEDWGTSKPAGTASDGTPRTSVGTITVDGDTYDVWKKTRTNKPAITGDNKTFDQYFSVRQTARQCGHISISEHFAQWTALGLQLGNLEEAKLLVEAQDNSGSIAFTTATVVVK